MACKASDFVAPKSPSLNIGDSFLAWGFSPQLPGGLFNRQLSVTQIEPFWMPWINQLSRLAGLKGLYE